MSTRVVSSQVSASANDIRAILATLGVLIAAVFGSALFAWSNSRFADWINEIVQSDSRLVNGLLFSSFPVVLAIAVMFRNPRQSGLRVGGSLARWRRTAALTAALCTLTALAVSQLESNPFSGADLVIEGIAVPVSEELVFRGVLFTVVLTALRHFHDAGRASVLAVLITAVGFGLAHLNNLGTYDTTFVLAQSTYAFVLGIAVGYLRASTSSLLPPILLHAAVNLVAVVW